MMPAYRSMDSHPYQQNQMAFPHYYQPGFEGSPPQMNFDPSKSPFSCEQPWPYAGYYGYPTLMHFCCGHHNFPSHCIYRPSYPHIPAPSPAYSSGRCPGYVEPFYAPYTLPPHYTVELPRYEYDKCMPREYHCCGCPNYPSSHKEGRSVKIEEHEPYVEKKGKNAMAPIELINYPYPFVWIPPEYASKREQIEPVAAEAGEPDVKKKGNNVVAPIQLKNYPYPLVWSPPKYMGNRELKKPVAAEVGDQDRILHDRMLPEYARANREEPKVWNGWFPLDFDSLSNMNQDGNGRRNKNGQIDNTKREYEKGRSNESQQSEKNGREFPFPLIWMPNYNIQDGERTNNQESTSTPKSIQEAPRAFKSVPVHSWAGDDDSNRINMNGNDSNTGGSDVTKEVTNEKRIPVKHMEPPKSDLEGCERKVRDIPVKQSEGNMIDMEFQTNVEKQSNSPQKTSKLPPVCLRVDPLPRKKSKNGTSRSPSPPASKEHSQATADGTSKAFASSSMSDKAQVDTKLQNASNDSGEVKLKEKSIKVVDKSSEKKDKDQRDGSQRNDKAQAELKFQTASNGSQRNDKAQAELKFQTASNINEEVKPKNEIIKELEKSSEEKGEDQRDGSQSSGGLQSSSALTGTKESWINGKEHKIKENEAERKVDSVGNKEATEAREVKDPTKRSEDECKKDRRVLSDTEAAALIQAAYRGFQVRKWEPLKKLKQTTEVSKHVTDVRESIQALENSSDLQNDEKERVKIGESIMRLLLKLDTIQGLHPSFREIRKSLAKELTSLQEKLDSIMAKKPQQQMEDLSARKPVEDAPLVAPNGEYMQGQPEEKVTVNVKDSAEGFIRESHSMLEQQPEKKVAAPGKDSSDGIIHVSQDQLSVKDGTPTHEDEKLHSVVHSLPSDDDKCKSSSSVDPVCNEETKPLPKGMVNKDISHDSAVEVSGSGISDVQNQTKPELEDIPGEVDDLDRNAWKELPQSVIDEPEVADIDLGKEKQNKIKSKELQVPGVTTAPEDRHFPAMMDDSAQDGASSQIHEMAELPVGVFDDDTATYEPEKHDETGILELALQTGEEECDAAPKTNSSADDISKETQLDQQQPQEQEEVQYTEESDGWVKLESQKDELKGDASLNVGNEQQSVTIELTRNDGHEVADEDACLGVEEVQAAKTPEEEVEKGEAREEDVVLKETQCEKEDIVAEQGMNADTENREASAKQMDDQSATLLVSEEVPIPEHDGEMDSDKNLVEENENLRKMMQKLLESGNEQLTVISNLTGRVKDLEKKLARKRRVKTRHCKPATSQPSCKKSSNKPLEGRAVGVAM